MRRLFFVVVALLWAAAGIILIQRLNQEDEGQIVQAFNETNCMDAQSQVSVSGQIKTGYLARDGQEKLLDEIAKSLGITGSYEITEDVEGNRTIVQLYREAAQAETSLKIISVETEISENVMETIQYLMADIILYDKLECAVSYKENLEKIMNGYGVSEEVSLSFSGELPGQIKAAERDALVKRLLESISARVRKQHSEDNVYTVYAYTKLVDTSQKINGETVNVTVAVTFDEENNRTKLYLATPLLTQDY